MNRYRITALEDVDVSVSECDTATILVSGVVRQVSTQSAPHWKHLGKDETCEVVALHGTRGDFFESSPLNLPAELTAPVVIHDALKIENLPRLETPPNNASPLPSTPRMPSQTLTPSSATASEALQSKMPSWSLRHLQSKREPLKPRFPVIPTIFH
jgi:hypothetical protein